MERIGARTPQRANIVHAAPVQDAHYVWKRDDIHLINLNVKPSRDGTQNAFEEYENLEGLDVNAKANDNGPLELRSLAHC